MRAVNLIPAELRGGPQAGVGRSGGAVFVLLGGLAALVLMAVLWAGAHGAAGDRRAQLAALDREAADARTQAAALARFREVAALRSSRTSTVRTLAERRFDWAATLDAIARTIPADAGLTSLDGDLATGPTLKLQGCARTHARVAELMVALRALPGVTGAQLASSSRASGSAASSAAGSGPGAAPGCAGRTPTSFSLNLGFGRPAAPASTAATVPGAAPAPAGAAAPPAATPAPSATPPAPAPAATTAAGPAPGAATTSTGATR